MPVIFHLDLDAFFASVEELENPAFKNKPLIIGGQAEERGVVASVNAVARRFEVRPGMTTARALRRCPAGLVIPPRLAHYQTYAERVFKLLRALTPLVEPVANDEAFLDLTDHLSPNRSPLDEARALQSRIKKEVGLSVSIGIATNKLLARIANRRSGPGSLSEVEPGTEAAFLALLPLRTLDGIGPKMAERLAELGVRTVGNLAALPEAMLIREFGIPGAALWRQAQGIDPSPVVTGRVVKSFSQAHTFSSDTDDEDLLTETLTAMSRTLAEKLRENNLAARTIALRLRYGDFKTFSRSSTQDPATNQARDIARQALYLWREHWQPHRPLRMVGLTVSNFVEGVEQLSLF